VKALAAVKALVEMKAVLVEMKAAPVEMKGTLVERSTVERSEEVIQMR
jgi:hypothetical protein